MGFLAPSWWVTPAVGSRYVVRRTLPQQGGYCTLWVACHRGLGWQAQEGEMSGSVRHPCLGHSSGSQWEGQARSPWAGEH